MAIVNSNQYNQFRAPWPLYLSPAWPGSYPTTNQESHSRFESQIHREIINLQERRTQLSEKLAQSKHNAPNTAFKQEIAQEYALLEQTRKFLSMIVEAIEKSRQSIAANFR